MQAIPSHHGTLSILAGLAFLNNGLLGCDASSTSSSLSATSSSSSQSISTVVATPTLLAPGDAFTLTWAYTSGDEAGVITTGDLKAFEIDLEHCPDGAGTCQCTGASLISLCPLTGPGCVDSDGSYDLVLPSEDLATSTGTTAAVSGEVYQIRVSLASNSEVFSCGHGFKVQDGAASEGEAVADSGTTSNGDGATNRGTLTAIPPEEVVIPGQAFTARWEYDSGEDGGEEAGNEFAVDLFSCAGGACDDGRCVMIHFSVADCCAVGSEAVCVRLKNINISRDLVYPTRYLPINSVPEGHPTQCIIPQGSWYLVG